MGGAAEAAAEKVVATVGSVKDIPPFLETEARALMLKVRWPQRSPQRRCRSSQRLRRLGVGCPLSAFQRHVTVRG